MGTYTDTYVEMLQEDLQHQYRRCFEVGTDLAQALQASEAKDKELAKEREKNTVLQLEVRRRLNLQMDTTAKVERRLVDALGVLSDRDIEVERLTFALKDKDEELAKEREKNTALQSELRVRGERLRNLDGRWSDMTRVVNDRDIEIERITSALKDKDNELEFVRDEHRTRIDELMTEIERLTRKNKKPFKVAELVAAQREMLATLDRQDGLISKAFGCIGKQSDSIYKQQQSIDNLWLYVQSIAAHINTGGSQENP